MHCCLIAIGSNFNRDKNIVKAKESLAQVLSEVVCSETLETEPIGLEGACSFYNLLLYGKSSLTIDELRLQCKAIEQQCGRNKEGDKAIIPLDLDVLLYDNLKFKYNDWKRDYIQQLLSDLNNKRDQFKI